MELDLQKLAEIVRELSDKLSALQAMLPVDAAEEQSETIDEATAGEEAVGDADDDKEARKAAAAAAISKQLG